VAYVVWLPKEERLVFAEADVPEWMLRHFAQLFARGRQEGRSKKQFICDLEEVALAAPYFSREKVPGTDRCLEDLLRGRYVLHFADNTAANCGAVNGYSASPSMARIVSALHMRWARMGTQAWIEFVKSEANLADDPSRGEFGWAKELGAEKIEFTFPPVEGWGDS
jgi:hypothetical protein